MSSSPKTKIALIGSGNWCASGACKYGMYTAPTAPTGARRGSAIAKIVGENVTRHEDMETEVKVRPVEREGADPAGAYWRAQMWVYEEMVEGRKLTEIINTEHENVKYLPGIKLPPNVVAVPDLADAVRGANLLVFNLPHQVRPKLRAGGARRRVVRSLRRALRGPTRHPARTPRRRPRSSFPASCPL